jgi:hypothetical protein
MSRGKKLDRILADCRDMLRSSACVSWDSLAEAGWRATIAAIEGLRRIADVAWDGSEVHPCGMDASQCLKAIIAACPEELL